MSGGIDQYTKLMLHGNGDLSNSHHNLIYNGNAKFDYISTPIDSGAYYFDGTDDNIEIEDSTDFDIGLNNNPFTLSFWFKTTASAIMSLYNRGGGINDWNMTNGNQLLIQYQNNTNAVEVYYNNNGSAINVQSPTFSLDGSWKHFALVYDGTNSKSSINGTFGSSISIGGYYKPTNSNMTTIGEYISNGSNYTGYLKDIEILKGIARWTSDFTPPTSEYTNVVLSSGIMGIFSWSNGIEENVANGMNFSQILEYVKLNHIYEGQWNASDQKIYGEGYKLNDKYNIDFYADSNRTYRTVHYESIESSGYNVAISREKFGNGIEGYISYSFSEVL